MASPSPAQSQHPSRDSSVTQCLLQIQGGSPGAESRLLELVYRRLRRMAGEKMRRERSDHTLQATALANEAYLKLRSAVGTVDWKNRAHFYKVCSKVMRNILIDHARRRTLERGDVELFPGVAITSQRSEELLALDRSLDRLALFDPRGAQTIELTQFLGLTQDEVATTYQCSVRTVKRDMAACLRWLRSDMGGIPLQDRTP